MLNYVFIIADLHNIYLYCCIVLYKSFIITIDSEGGGGNGDISSQIFKPWARMYQIIHQTFNSEIK